MSLTKSFPQPKRPLSIVKRNANRSIRLRTYWLALSTREQMNKTRATDKTTFHDSHEDNSSPIISNGRVEIAPKIYMKQPIVLRILLPIAGVKGVTILHFPLHSIYIPKIDNGQGIERIILPVRDATLKLIPTMTPVSTN